MRFDSLSAFYLSKEWKTFRDYIINSRTDEYGILRDEYSGEAILNSSDCIVHHKKPLTAQNVNDSEISLNPSNVLCVTMKSHNEIHKRFGNTRGRKVYVIHGSPLSGKTTFVEERLGNSDIVIDSDNIWQCITGKERYYKPNALKQNFFMVRDCLIDSVRSRVGNWETAFVISSEPYKTPLENMCKKLGAELIEIKATREECLKRLNENPDGRDIAIWSKLINDYFNAYFL